MFRTAPWLKRPMAPVLARSIDLAGRELGLNLSTRIENRSRFRLGPSPLRDQKYQALRQSLPAASLLANSPIVYPKPEETRTSKETRRGEGERDQRNHALLPSQYKKQRAAKVPYSHRRRREKPEIEGDAISYLGFRRHRRRRHGHDRLMPLDWSGIIAKGACKCNAPDRVRDYRHMVS
jgi:hypothetical protein